MVIISKWTVKTKQEKWQEKTYAENRKKYHR